MPKHKPIKFESILEPNLKNQIIKIIKENPKAKTTLNAVLGLIAIGGVLTIGPAAFGLMREIGRFRQTQKKERYEEYRKIWERFNLLKKQRAIKYIKEEDGCLFYKLTDKGKEKIKKFTFDELSVTRPKVWDKKWRLIIFDIPEVYKKSRNALRKKLIDLGFYQCQKSVWIYPFPCENEIEFIKDILNIKPFVKLFLVEEMDDGKVLFHFKDSIKNK